jgi:hypothetical protein
VEGGETQASGAEEDDGDDGLPREEKVAALG